MIERRIRPVVVAACVLLVATSCGSKEASVDSGKKTTTTTVAAGTTTARPAAVAGGSIYWLVPSGSSVARQLVPVYRDGITDPSSAVMDLFQARSLTDARVLTTARLLSAIPAGSKLNTLATDAGVATVDVSNEFLSAGSSDSMMQRLAQLIYTVTQFDAATKIRLQVEGQAVTDLPNGGPHIGDKVGREFFQDSGIIPKVFVDEPAEGAPVVSPFVVSGQAKDIFEATLNYEVHVGTEKILAGSITTSGQIGWSTYSTTLHRSVKSVQKLTLSVFEPDAESGQVLNRVKRTFNLLPG